MSSMNGMIAQLLRYNAQGEITKATNIVADVNTVRDVGIVEIEMDLEDGKRLGIRFDLADFVRQAVIGVA